MLRKTFLCVLALLWCLAPACGWAQSQITGLSQLADKTIAVPQGTIAGELVLKALPGATLKYYDNVLDCAVAVKVGQADAAAYDEPSLRSILRTNSDLWLLPEFITHDAYGFAVNKNRPDLKKVADACIDELADSGVFESMRTFWYGTNGYFISLSRGMETGTVGVLRFGTFPRVEPFSVRLPSGEIVGIDIELASYIAYTLNMELEVYEMPYDQMIPALLQNRVDMIGAGMIITEERAKDVLFTKPYFQGGIAVLVRK